MKNAHIFDGDPVVVDHALQAAHESIIITLVNGDFSIKQLHIHSDGNMELASAHPRFPPLKITHQVSFEVWGVVIFVLRSTHPSTPLKTRPAASPAAGQPMKPHVLALVEGNKVSCSCQLLFAVVQRDQPVLLLSYNYTSMEMSTLLVMPH